MIEGIEQYGSVRLTEIQRSSYLPEILQYNCSDNWKRHQITEGVSRQIVGQYPIRQRVNITALLVPAFLVNPLTTLNNERKIIHQQHN